MKNIRTRYRCDSELLKIIVLQVLRRRPVLFLNNLSSIPTLEVPVPAPTSPPLLPSATTFPPVFPSPSLLKTTPPHHRPTSPRRSRSRICPRRLPWCLDPVVVLVVEPRQAVSSTCLTSHQYPATLLSVVTRLRWNIECCLTNTTLSSLMFQDAGDDEDIDFDDLTKRFEALKKKK